jgi:hypothetical protein
VSDAARRANSSELTDYFKVIHFADQIRYEAPAANLRIEICTQHFADLADEPENGIDEAACLAFVFGYTQYAIVVTFEDLIHTYFAPCGDIPNCAVRSISIKLYIRTSKCCLSRGILCQSSKATG